VVEMAAPVWQGDVSISGEAADAGLLCLVFLLLFHHLSVDTKAGARRFVPDAEVLNWFTPAMRREKNDERR